MPSALANVLTPTQVTFTFSGFPSAYTITSAMYSGTQYHFRNVTGLNRTCVCTWDGVGYYRFETGAMAIAYESMSETDGVPGPWFPGQDWLTAIVWWSSLNLFYATIGPTHESPEMGMHSNAPVASAVPLAGAFPSASSAFLGDGPTALVTLSGWA